MSTIQSSLSNDRLGGDFHAVALSSNVARRKSRCRTPKATLSGASTYRLMPLEARLVQLQPYQSTGEMWAVDPFLLASEVDHTPA